MRAIPRFVVLISQDLLIKMKPDHIAALAKLVLSWFGGPYLREWLDFLSLRVNQADLSCPWGFFETLAQSFGDDKPLTKLIFAQSVYDKTVVQDMVRPAPDVCKLYKQARGRAPPPPPIGHGF